jgi:hypothetical protein
MGRRMKSNAQLAGTLGGVEPGAWATLASGQEVMVSWHAGSVTNVRKGQGNPEPLPSSTPVARVRQRQRVVVDGDAVADPVGGGERQQIWEDMPLLGGGR